MDHQQLHLSFEAPSLSDRLFSEGLVFALTDWRCRSNTGGGSEQPWSVKSSWLVIRIIAALLVL